MPAPLRFDCYEVDVAAGQLRRRGVRIRLRGQSFQVLESLLERPGEVVTREELRRRLWPTGVFVDFENSLNAAVARLREALGDSAGHPRFIETLPRRGYRFMAASSQLSAAPAAEPAKRVRLLVLPFVNASGDPAQASFSDAITDDVINELAALAPRELAVIARTTAMRYKGTQKDVAQIGRELRVDFIVEGGIRRAGARLSLNVQVVRPGDRAHVFARRYDGDPAAVFALQGRIAREVADHVGQAAGVDGLRFREADASRATRTPTDDVVAYNEYIQGVYYVDHFGAGPRGHETARAHLEKALARDPAFAPAHEALADLYWTLGYVGIMPPRDAFAAGILHAVRALQSDNTRAETHALIAHYQKQLDYDWPAIQQGLARALDLNPASPMVRMFYAVGWLMPQGHLREAIAELERALEWDPLCYRLHHWRNVMLSLAREADRVIENARVQIDLEPTAPYGLWLLGVGLSRKGRFDEAFAALRTAVDLSGGSALMLGWFGLILGAGGREDEARGVLERLEATGRTNYVPPASVALVYLGLREVDRAFAWLDRAVDAHDQLMMPIKTYPFFDPIRNDPRFHALLRKMKLEP